MADDNSNAMSSSEGLERALQDPILRDVYVPLAELPVITSAGFVHGNETISITTSTRDHAASTWMKKRFEIGVQWTETVQERSYLSLDESIVAYNSGASVPSVPINDDTVKAVWQSPDEKVPYKIILRESTKAATPLVEGGSKRRAVEVWKGHRCQHRIDVTKKHGAFATDDTFGTLDYRDGRILYAAEANIEAWDDPQDDLARYDYRPILGEKLQARVRTTLFLVTLSDSSVKELKVRTQDEHFEGPMVAKSVLAYDATAVYATILTLAGDGRRLGQVYCTNRPSSIHQISLPAAAATTWEVNIGDDTCLSDSRYSASSPYAVHNSVVFLGVPVGGPHNASCTIFRANKSRTEGIVYPFAEPMDPSGQGLYGKWPGLFVQSIPTFALLNRGPLKYLVVTSIRHARKTPVIIDLNGSFSSTSLGCFPLMRPTPSMALCVPRRKVAKGKYVSARTLLEQKREDWSYTVLGTDLKEAILAVRSRPNVPQQLVVGTMIMLGNLQPSVQWSVVWRADEGIDNEDLFDQLAAVQSSIVDVEKVADGVQSIVVRPPMQDGANEKVTPPFILFPHGGPHTASTTDWSPAVAALAILGYTVALPNYSGSLGISESFVYSLLGNCGKLDVDDCFATVEQLIDEKVASRDSLFITGGSHGGFLAGHAIARKYFKAAVMRNPVIAVGQQAITSDIPDWCYEEFGKVFDFNKPPVIDAETFAFLEERSPIATMHQIDAPVLLLAGLKDLRVPYWSQAKVLYHALKARNKKVRMLTFKDADHALDTIEAEAISVLSTVRWFRQALSPSSEAEPMTTD